VYFDGIAGWELGRSHALATAVLPDIRVIMLPVCDGGAEFQEYLKPTIIQVRSR
jgi:hypothetical protein